MWQNLFKKKKGSPFTFLRKGEGFTLVELLIVISIISLMMIVVLVNLNNSRNKGKDAGIKMVLLEVTKAAGFLHDTTAFYEGVCDVGNITLADTGDFRRIKEYIERNGGIISCIDSDTGYAVISTLNQIDCWCVDWQGSSKEVELEGAETCSSKLITTSCPQ